METILNLYYANNANKLHKMVDKILIKLKFHDIDNEDFYSLANEVFVDVLKRYDNSKDFDGFLYSSLYKKFCTEMTRRNRQKRQADKNSVSIYTPFGDEDENSTLGDMIADGKTVEREFFEEKEEGYSKEMCNYLGRLSTLQKEVLRLISIGFMPNEILEELHINKKIYEDCYNAIHSYRNISVLI